MIRRVLYLCILVALLITDTLVSFHMGTQHGNEASTIKTLANQNVAVKHTPAKASSTYGPNVNFGSFSLVGTVEAVTESGLVVQTSGGNTISIAVDQTSVMANPSGKKLTLRMLTQHDTVSIVARLNAGGQFVALRIIEE